MNTRLMMLVALNLISLPMTAQAGEEQPQSLEHLKNPESATVGADGRIYASEIGEFDQDGDGRILLIDKETGRRSFAEGLNDPKGLALWAGWLYVADKDRVVRIDEKGQQLVIAGAKDFPRAPEFLNDLEVDAEGNLYVSDSGDLQGDGGAIYKIDQRHRVTEVKFDAPTLGSPNGLLMDGSDQLLVVDLASGTLHRVQTRGGGSRQLSDGYGAADGLARDRRGRIYISDWKNGRVFVLEDSEADPRLIADNFESAADIALAPGGASLLVPDMKAGKLVYLPLPE